ncbi:MAG: hypothetical protein ACI841_003226 [Planctomycetota bacterium]|jgi:hypothetical protein
MQLAGVEGLKFYGDLRLRQESSFELPMARDRSRQRTRVRFGVNYQIDDELTAGARVVTGNRDDPNSQHHTFGTANDGIELSLDRAFLTWRPDELEGSELTAGKFNLPFYRNEVYGELVWDADVQPEGILLRQRLHNVAGLDRVDMTVAGIVLSENSRASDSHALLTQCTLHENFGEDLSSTFAASYYHYADLQPDGSLLLLDDNSGNSTLDLDADGMADTFASDFGIANLILGIGYSGLGPPITFSGEFVHNRHAVMGQADGWAAGISLGSTKQSGDTKYYYQWQDIERDSVFSPFAQDDFVFTTGHRSHVFGVNRQLTADVGLHLWGLVSEPADDPADDDERWRLRLDLNVKF